MIVEDPCVETLEESDPPALTQPKWAKGLPPEEPKAAEGCYRAEIQSRSGQVFASKLVTTIRIFSKANPS